MTSARKAPYDPLQPDLLVCHNDMILSHNTGEVLSDIHLQSLVRHWPAGGYIAGVNLYPLVASLNDILSDLPGWRMRCTAIPRTRRGQVVGPNGRPAMIGRFKVDYLTFVSTHSHKTIGHRQIKWWVFNLDSFTDKPPDTLEGKRDMAIAHLDMLAHRGVTFKTSRGSTGLALLRKSPKWTSTTGYKRRVAAPKFINDQARAVLPGNFYSVKHEHLGIEHKMDHCYLIDQNSAHHNIAATVPLPHSEWIRARGHYRDRDKARVWIARNTESEQTLLNTHIGLVYTKIEVGHIPPKQKHLYPKWADKPGTKLVWLWTPELRLFNGDPKMRVVYYVCGLTATRKDDALQEYAQWALGELKLPGKRYKKSTLLSAYGMLAMNTEAKDKALYAWAGTLPVKGYSAYLPVLGDVTIRKPFSPKAGKFYQPGFLNVAARGVIEAETRTRSIEYARQLERQGIEVAQIYVDAVLVKATQLPFTPDSWTVSHALSEVIIPRPNGIRSREVTKLPGVSGDRRRSRESARGPLAGLTQSQRPIR